jgi:hypothetical protein
MWEKRRVTDGWTDGCLFSFPHFHSASSPSSCESDRNRVYDSRLLRLLLHGADCCCMRAYTTLHATFAVMPFDAELLVR